MQFVSCRCGSSQVSLAFSAVLGLKETPSVSVIPCLPSMGVLWLLIIFWTFCNEVFNFLLKRGHKLTCLLQGEPRQQRGTQHWGCLLQPSLIFHCGFITDCTKQVLAGRTQRAREDKHAFSTRSFTNLQWILDVTTSIQFWLKHKWPFSFQSVEFQNVASNWHYTLFFQCWGTKFSCSK